MTTLSIDDPWFQLFADGIKTVEGRLNKGKFSALSAGSSISVLSNRGECLQAMVVEIRHYMSFREFLVGEGLEKTLPGIKTIEAGLEVYNKYYPVGTDTHLGVLGIQLVVIPQ